jgi:hypothetical protein
MYALHAITAIARSLTRQTGSVLVALALTLGLAVGVSPAQATVDDAALFDNLPTTGLYAGCVTSGSARWDRAQNLLTLNGSAHSSAPFDSCRVRLNVTFYAQDDEGELNIASKTVDINTACAVLDPTCPSTQPLNVVIPQPISGKILGFSKQFITDHIRLTAEARR